MFGWLSRAAAWASARSRRRKAGSVLVDGGRTLTATCRPRTSSNPRHTTDIPPAPRRPPRRGGAPPPAGIYRLAGSIRAGPSCSCAPTCALRRNAGSHRHATRRRGSPGPLSDRTFPIDGEDVSPPRRLPRDADTRLHLRIVTDGFPAYASCRGGHAGPKVGSRTHFPAAL